jgi:hypothetical protein
MIPATLGSKGLKDTMDTDKKNDSSAEEATVVPLPAVDTAREHQRVRSSNDRDQERERDGKVAPHNQGYDEVADLTAVPTSEPGDE